MKLNIKKEGLSLDFVTDSKELVAKIMPKNITNNTKRICDSKNNTVYTTNIVESEPVKEAWNYEDTKKYILFKNNKPFATANIHFAIHPERTVPGIILQRPPQIDNMDIDTPYGILNVVRQKDNSIVILQNKEPIAKVSQFFGLKKMSLEYTKDFGNVFWAGIYMLIDYMMHEDNLIAVWLKLRHCYCIKCWNMLKLLKMLKENNNDVQRKFY